MNHLTLRGLGAIALGLVLAACGAEQPVAPGDPMLDVSTLATTPNVVINEVMADPATTADDLGEWFEVYNAGTEAVDLQGWVIASNNDANHTISASVVVQPGAYAVLARRGNDVNGGGINPAYVYSTQTSTGGFTAFNMANGADWIALRTPGASGFTVDSVAWTGATSGRSRGLKDPALDNVAVNGTNWTLATTVFYNTNNRGTPNALNEGGTITPPPPPHVVGSIVINEVLPNPAAVLDSVGEWFEILNVTSAPVDLAGWTIVSSGDAAHTITGPLVVPAGGYALLGRNTDPELNGGVVLQYSYHAGEATLNLSNSSDILVLRDAAGATVDSVAWAAAPPNGASRALISATSANMDLLGSAWTLSTSIFGDGDKGTPGLTNTTVTGGEPGVVATISLSINTPRQIPVGYTKPAFATAKDGLGNNVFPVVYTWSSSAPSIATVDSLGYVRGLAVGTATISATAPNGVSGTTTITILPADAPTSAVYRNHVEFGTPDGAPGILLSKREFVSSYSETRGAPSWVSWNLNATQFGSAARCDCFSADLALPSDVYKVVDFDYRNSGYDRGHMVQSESRTATLQENAATFLMTNIVPQAGENNQGPWVAFENYLNDLARTGGKEVYVVAGGEYGANPQTLKGQGRVQIPAFTWKVAVVVDGGEGLDDVHGTGDLQVLAIRMPNDTATARGIRNTPWQNYTTTVDDIEARTGLDLLDALPNTLERIVEANDRAPVAATDGPYVGLEGSSVTLSAAGSSDPDGDALTYEWSFGDGAEGTGASPTHTYADNGTYQVRVIVTDPYGAADSATTTVTVMNVAPQVAAFAGASLLQGETYTAAGSFGDPGADEWTATVDYGDGAGAQPLALSGNGFTLSHGYAAAGTYTVTVRVTDDEGAEGVRTATVTVRSPAQAVTGLEGAVDGLVSDGSLSRGNGNSLSAKLRAAGASLARGQAHTAVNQLNAFVNEVEAMAASGRLSAVDAATLTAAAQRIIQSIQSL
jgi:DNA/RNA endonuclease G (NUC1)